MPGALCRCWYTIQPLLVINNCSAACTASAAARCRDNQKNALEPLWGYFLLAGTGGERWEWVLGCTNRPGKAPVGVFSDCCVPQYYLTTFRGSPSPPLAGGCGDWHLAQLLLAAAPRHGPIISSNSHDPATESFVEHNKKNKISRFTATTSHNWMAKVGCFSLSEPTARGGPRPQLGADLSSQSWHRLLVFLQPPAGRSVKIFMYLFGSCKNYRRI